MNRPITTANVATQAMESSSQMASTTLHVPRLQHIVPAADMVQGDEAQLCGSGGEVAVCNRSSTAIESVCSAHQGSQAYWPSLKTL